MARTPHHRRDGSLVVHAVYLRPIERPGVLARLAELGLFVCEHHDATDGGDCGCDLALVAVAEESGYRRVVTHTSRRMPTVVLAPAGSTDTFAGAAAVIRDDAPPAEFAAALARGARAARQEMARRAPSLNTAGTMRIWPAR